MKTVRVKTLLKRGEFLGGYCKELELRDFTIKEMVDHSEQEIPRHMHEDAHFLFILDGLYIKSATDAEHRSSPSTLIFNPIGHNSP